MSEQKEVKNIDFELKEDNESLGEVKAVFSVFNNIDSDGDVVLPNAIKSGFNSGDVPMVWAHKWDMPIGKGKIKQDKDMATFEGKFFMDTESGKEAYNLVKSMGDLQQWSFGFRVLDSEYGKFKKDANDEGEDVRYLKDLEVYEVSPVLVGANQETFTMAIKSTKEDTNEKGVLGHDSFSKEEPGEEECKGYGKCDYDKTGKCAKDMKEDDSEEEKAKPTGDLFMSAAEAEDRASQLGCQGSHTFDSNGQMFYMPCATHEDYDAAMKKSNTAVEHLEGIANAMKEVLKSIPTDELSINTLEEVKEKIVSIVNGDSEVSEKGASVQGKRFSDEVKDVLAALNNLVARVQSIGELRQKNGRKLGVSATEALRAVQESVQDAFEEIDKFVDEFGSEGALEDTTAVVEEIEETADLETEVSEPVAEETTEEVAEEEVEATAETPDPAEEPEVDTGDERTDEDPVDAVELPTEEVLDDELDGLWLESQEILAESIMTDIEIQEEEIIEE